MRELHVDSVHVSTSACDSSLRCWKLDQSHPPSVPFQVPLEVLPYFRFLSEEAQRNVMSQLIDNFQTTSIAKRGGAPTSAANTSASSPEGLAFMRSPFAKVGCVRLKYWRVRVGEGIRLVCVHLYVEIVYTCVSTVRLPTRFARRASRLQCRRLGGQRPRPATDHRRHLLTL